MNSNIRQMMGWCRAFLVCSECGAVIECEEKPPWPSVVLCDSCLSAYVGDCVHSTVRFLVQVKGLGQGIWRDYQEYMVVVKYAEKGSLHFEELDYYVDEIGPHGSVLGVRPAIDKIKDGTYLSMIKGACEIEQVQKLTRWDHIEI